MESQESQLPDRSSIPDSSSGGNVSEHSSGDHEDDEDYQPSDGGKTGEAARKRKACCFY